MQQVPKKTVIVQGLTILNRKVTIAAIKINSEEVKYSFRRRGILPLMRRAVFRGRGIIE